MTWSQSEKISAECLSGNGPSADSVYSQLGEPSWQKEGFLHYVVMAPYGEKVYLLLNFSDREGPGCDRADIRQGPWETDIE